MRLNHAAIVLFTALVAASAMVAAGVGTYRVGGRYGERFGEDSRYIKRFTDARTGELKTIVSDRNRDGQMDCWDFFDRGRWIRTETDDDGDGTIDHWFFYDDHENVSKMGLSSKNDGIPDAWWYDGPQSGMHRIEYTAADGSITKTEYYEQGQLVRVTDAAADSRQEQK